MFPWSRSTCHLGFVLSHWHGLKMFGNKDQDVGSVFTTNPEKRCSFLREPQMDQILVNSMVRVLRRLTIVTALILKSSGILG